MWPNPQETPDLVTFTEEILNGTLHFLCNDNSLNYTVRNDLALYKKKELESTFLEVI